MDVTLNILKALADETRLKILSLLLDYDCCVGGLSQRITISGAAVSQHLQVLRKAGLVRGEKRGYWTHYSVEKEVIMALAQGLESMVNSPGVKRVSCPQSGGEGDCCPGEEVFRMCQCKHPQKMREQGEKCSAEQVKECHGDEQEHRCEKEKE